MSWFQSFFRRDNASFDPPITRVHIGDLLVFINSHDIPYAMVHKDTGPLVALNPNGEPRLPGFGPNDRVSQEELEKRLDLAIRDELLKWSAMIIKEGMGVAA